MTNHKRNMQWICIVIFIILITGCFSISSIPVKISMDTTLIPKEAALNYLRSISITSQYDCDF